MKKSIWLLAFLFMVGTVLAGCAVRNESKAAEPKSAVAGQLTVTVLDVGQADAILVQKSGRTALIDAGLSENAEALVLKLRKLGVERINLLIATHPHADHIGGMVTVLKAFPVDTVYDTGQVTTTKTYQKYLQTVKDKKIPFKLLRRGEVLALDESTNFAVLFPEDQFLTKTSRSDLNANSAVLRLNYKQFSMLLTRDATSETEARLLALPDKEQLKVQVLKVAHHMSRYSTTTTWLKAVSPEAAIASYAKNNDYGFPHEQTMKRVGKTGAAYYNTADNGDVSVISDGQTYRITTEK